MITTFYPPYSFGGDGVFVRRLANELAQRGHQVDVVHCIDAYRLLARQQPSHGYEDHPNVSVHGLKSPFAFLSPLTTQQTGVPFFKRARIREILDKGHDVIHYHNISLFGPKILEYGEAIKLYTMHEYWLVCPTHTLFRFNREPCTRRHCLPCTLTYGQPPQLWRYVGLLEAAIKHTDAFIAPSRFTKEAHQQRGLKAPIVHLPPFVPSGASRPRSVADVPAEPYFLFVGRLEKLKGLQTLIPVFRRYRKAHLLVAGQGSYEPQLRQLADGDGIVRFLGHLPDWRLEPLYERAIAVLVPSICFEVFPSVILEAFTQRTPAIVRNLGGMPEIIADSSGGLVYNTEAELIEAMDRLLADASYRRQLGECAYRAYQQKWTPDAHLGRYLALIRQIAATRG
jgi:glycosyltransferase involved in cell wall biosynthesis